MNVQALYVAVQLDLEIYITHMNFTVVFPTRLLTSEDEYKWYWHQMIYFPETINTISATNAISPTHSLVSS
jgi:hypothetical protein